VTEAACAKGATHRTKNKEVIIIDIQKGIKYFCLIVDV